MRVLPDRRILELRLSQILGNKYSEDRQFRSGIRYARSRKVYSLLAVKKFESLTHIQSWALNLEQRSCHNKATIALANKMARSIWAIWTGETTYNSNDALRFAV